VTRGTTVRDEKKMPNAQIGMQTEARVAWRSLPAEARAEKCRMQAFDMSDIHLRERALVEKVSQSNIAAREQPRAP